MVPSESTVKYGVVLLVVFTIYNYWNYISYIASGIFLGTIVLATYVLYKFAYASYEQRQHIFNRLFDNIEKGLQRRLMAADILALWNEVNY